MRTMMMWTSSSSVSHRSQRLLKKHQNRKNEKPLREKILSLWITNPLINVKQEIFDFCTIRNDLVLSTVLLWFQASLDETTGERCSYSERHSCTNLKGYDGTENCEDWGKSVCLERVKVSQGRCKPDGWRIRAEADLSRTVWDRQS